MHISGSGHIPAGEYNDKISVSGSGKLDGNVRCTAFSASGSAHCAGALECAEDVRVSGSAHIDGGVTAASLSVSGSAHIGGDLTVKETVRVAGSVKVDGEIKSGAVHSAGVLRVEKGIEAEVVKLNCITPIDPAVPAGSLKKTGVLLVAEDSFAHGSVGERLAAALKEQGVDGRIVCVTCGEGFVRHGTVSLLKEELGLDGAGIARRALEVLGRG